MIQETIAPNESSVSHRAPHSQLTITHPAMTRNIKIKRNPFQRWQFDRQNLWAYIIIVLLASMYIWLIVDNPLGVLYATTFFIVGMGVLFGLFVLVIKVIDRLRLWRYLRNLNRLLNNKTLEEVLDASPYDYGFGDQGDDFLHIWRKDDPGSRKAIRSFLNSSVGARNAAILWIVERFVEEES